MTGLILFAVASATAQHVSFVGVGTKSPVCMHGNEQVVTESVPSSLHIHTWPFLIFFPQLTYVRILVSVSAY